MIEFKNVITVDEFNPFCGGCNSAISMNKFIKVEEGQSFIEAWKNKDDNRNDELFDNVRFLGFCKCGNVFILPRQ